MNAETNRPNSAASTQEETHSSSLPLFLTASSSSLKSLRARNRTNLKRRIKLSRSQVLSADFENDDGISTATTNNKTIIATPTSSQPASTPIVHAHSDLYTKTVSPKTPSPIHTTVTCSQVWERLASNEEHQTATSSKPAVASGSSTSSLPTHISFSYNLSDNDDDGEDVPTNEKDDFQYVPISSQSKLVQFQFLAFAKQQKLDSDSDDDHNEKHKTTVGKYISDDDDDSEDEEHDNFDDHYNENQPEEHEVDEQENRMSKKRKRSISMSHSLDNIPVLSTTNENVEASASVAKPPRSKKPKIKDPNANFQRLNMRKKQYSYAKKHQFAKHKRNAFYRRMRHAGTNK